MPRFYIAGLFAAIAFAWIGALVHRSGHAPVGLVSVGLGIALGGVLAILAATLRVAGPRALVVATLVLAAVAVITQHAWLYADFRREWRKARENSPQVAMFRDELPWSPGEYMLHEATPQRVALWCLDASLIMASAAATMWVMRRRALANSNLPPTPKSLTSDP